MIHRFLSWLYPKPKPKPLTSAQYQEMLESLTGIPEVMYGANVNRDYENSWRESPKAEVISIRRPTPFKADQKDRYL
jgi:hypothetical protein